jgi:O-antigen/teichoic acid export membrane protein
MKSILLATLTSWCARFVAIALNIVGIPLALGRLGPSRFSLLLVILSIGSWIGFANIGMGRVISNIVARRRRSTSRFTIETVSLATVLAAVLNLLLFVIATGLFFLLMSIVPLTDVIAANYREFVVSIVSLFFALSLWFFLSVFEGIDAGHHRLHRLYVFQLGSYLLSLVILLLVFPAHPSIWFAACLLNVGFLLGSICHAADVVRRNRTLFSLKFKWPTRLVRLVLLSSLDFTIISLGIGVVYQLATGLFGIIAGPHAVVELGILMRLMQSYGALLVAFTYPVSNIVASKLKRQELTSVVHTVRLSGLMLLGGASIGAGGFLLLGNPILSFWLRSPIDLDRPFLIGGALLIFFSSLHFFLAALLIGTAATKTASRIHIAEAVVFVPIAYLLFRGAGQSGVLVAMDIVVGAGALMMVGCLRAHPVLGELFAANKWTEQPATR